MREKNKPTKKITYKKIEGNTEQNLSSKDSEKDNKKDNEKDNEKVTCKLLEYKENTDLGKKIIDLIKNKTLIEKKDNEKSLEHKWKYVITKDKYQIKNFLTIGGNSNVYNIKTQEDNKYIRKICESIWKNSSGARELIILLLINKLDTDKLPKLKHYDVDRETGEISFILEKYTECDEEKLRQNPLDVLEGLEILHKYGILHTDLKKENILWKNNHCVIIDFSNSEWIYPPFKLINYNMLSTNDPLVLPPDIDKYRQQYYKYDMWAFSNLCCPETAVINPSNRMSINDYYKIYNPKKAKHDSNILSHIGKIENNQNEYFNSFFINAECLTINDLYSFEYDLENFKNAQWSLLNLYHNNNLLSPDDAKKRFALLDWLLNIFLHNNWSLDIFFYTIQLFDHFTNNKFPIGSSTLVALACTDLALRVIDEQHLSEKLFYQYCPSDNISSLYTFVLDILMSQPPVPLFIVSLLYLDYLDNNIKNNKPLYFDILNLDWSIYKMLYLILHNSFYDLFSLYQKSKDVNMSISFSNKKTKTVIESISQYFRYNGQLHHLFQ